MVRDLYHKSERSERAICYKSKAYWMTSCKNLLLMPMFVSPHRRRGIMTEQTYDRATQDAGNILALEHVNVTVPDQAMATTFYVSGLGFTRDPYMMVGQENMWVNIGQQQFHLPTRAPQIVRGHVGIVVPDREALRARLKRVESRLAGTAFAWSVEKGYIAVMCPWGNRF